MRRARDFLSRTGAHQIVRSRLARDTASTLVLKVVSTGLGFLVAVLLARLLGAGGYGVYAFALATMTLLSIPAQIGLPTLVMRETARGVAFDHPHHVRGVWIWAGRATMVLSLVIGIGAVAVITATSDGAIGTQAITMLWALGLVPLIALGNLRGAALRGLGRIAAGQLPEFMVRPGLLLLALAGAAVLSTSLTPPRAMAAHVLASALAFVVGAFMLWHYTPASVKEARPRSQSRAWMASTMPLALIAGISTVNAQADILLLGALSTPAEVGTYRVAIQIAAVAALGLNGVNLAVAPRFARLYARGDIQRLQRLATGSSRLVLGLALVVTVIFVSIGRMFLTAVFGPEFDVAYYPMVILLAGQLVNSLAGSVGHLLNMAGFERDTARAAAGSAVLNVALNFVLIPIWGPEGAATAATISLSVRNVLQWRAVRRRMGINSMAIGARTIQSR